MSTRAIRVDGDVAAELKRRRLPGETTSDEAIMRALEERELEERLSRHGLGMGDMARLLDLRAARDNCEEAT